MPENPEIVHSFELQMELVTAAVREFNRREHYLIENDLSERCMCARFAMYLEYQLREMGLQGYVADVEYNRGMDGYECCQKCLDDSLISVDLIVHKREWDNNYGFYNLLCMEMKKSNNSRGCRADEERLKKMTDSDHGFCYKAGIMLWVDMKHKELQIKAVFRDGKQVED